MTESLPRRFGPYLLTAHLGEDALGRVYRAIRMSGERTFVRLRVLEGPEISEDPVLDAIEENGEIHSFLKNPAIARGVQLDAVEGVPFLAWNDENGRTLDSLLERSHNAAQPVPYEHALLIAEKIATALDHAYNTTVDGERTLHGLVWPGFISLTDDGETRLTGFGLATGFFSSFSRPRFAQEIAPYLAPEERAQDRIARNSDVYSVGAILFALLMGRPPNTADPLLDLRTVRREGVGVAPEVAALLRMCLAPEEDRYQSTGDLRRELGKLLFSGPYAPSTFNLAFFLNGLFAADIEEETNSRLKEAALEEAQQGDPGRPPSPPVRPVPPPAALARPPGPAASAPLRGREQALPPIATSRDRTPPLGTGAGEALPAFGMPRRESRRPPSAPPPPPPPPRSRTPLYAGGTLLVLAAVGGGILLLVRRSPPPAPAPVPTAIPATPTSAPPTPVAPTSAMTEAQFKEEVSRRVAQELKKMETENRRRTPTDAGTRRSPPAGTANPSNAPAETAVASPAPTAAAPVPAAEAPTPLRAPAAVATEPPSAAPREVVPTPEVEIAPKILRVVKPVYPPMALRAKIGGTVLLRVLVGENGAPLSVQVISGAPAGLTESAVAAVRKWLFTPGQRGGAPVEAWTTVPIPFEP